LEIIPEKISIMKKLGLRYFVYGMIANPGETEQTIRESVRYSVWAEAGIGSGRIAVPYPGTKLFEQAKKTFGDAITWDDMPRISGRVGTDLFKNQSVDMVYFKIFVWSSLERIRKKLNLRPKLPFEAQKVSAIAPSS